MCIGVLAGYTFVSRALAGDERKRFRESLAVGRLTIVEAKRLFVRAAEQTDGL